MVREALSEEATSGLLPEWQEGTRHVKIDHMYMGKTKSTTCFPWDLECRECPEEAQRVPPTSCRRCHSPLRPEQLWKQR